MSFGFYGYVPQQQSVDNNTTLSQLWNVAYSIHGMLYDLAFRLCSEYAEMLEELEEALLPSTPASTLQESLKEQREVLENAPRQCAPAA